VAAAGLALLLVVTAAGWYAAWYYSFDSRFARSRPALEAYAAEVMASDPATPIHQPPRHLGAFETGRAERLPHGFLFFCDYGNPFDANGIAYSTEPIANSIGGRDFLTHIEGSWYTIWRN
jgi:hypothetical protein